MSECRALTNIVGNGVACVVVSAWEGELDRQQLGNAIGHVAAGSTGIRGAKRIRAEEIIASTQETKQ
jgi:aerobic C4-dicarboxylate transport protein